MCKFVIQSKSKSHRTEKCVIFMPIKETLAYFCLSVVLCVFLPRSTDKILKSSVLVYEGQKKDSTEYSKSNGLICKPPAQSIKVQM